MIRKSLFFILLLGTIVLDCKAQGTTYIALSIPITISEVLDLEVSPSTTLTFNFATTTQIDNGITQVPAQTLTFKSNKAYYITIKGIGITSNFSGGIAGSPMPISMLKYKLSTSTEWIPLSTTSQVLTGSATSMNPRGTGTILVDFKVDPGYITHPAQDYMVTISYSIANQ